MAGSASSCEGRATAAGASCQESTPPTAGRKETVLLERGEDASQEQRGYGAVGGLRAAGGGLSAAHGHSTAGCPTPRPAAARSPASVCSPSSTLV